MINKKTFIITSLGRTGTKFFYNFFKEMYPDCDSFHEPDVFRVLSKSEGIQETFGQLRDAGFKNSFLKLFKKWSLVKISDDKIKGKIDNQTAAKLLEKKRKKFIESKPGKFYLESSLGYYGLLDVLNQVFKDYKAIYIIRDGRDWVRSCMNWGEVYKKGAVRRLFAHNWPQATDFYNDSYNELWTKMSRFEKLCWAWTKFNKYAIKISQGDSNVKVVRFENVFYQNNRLDYVFEVLNFLTSENFKNNKIIAKKIDNLLSRKIHKSEKNFPNWERWDKKYLNKFNQICGDLMNDLGYY